MPSAFLAVTFMDVLELALKSRVDQTGHMRHTRPGSGVSQHHALHRDCRAPAPVTDPLHAGAEKPCPRQEPCPHRAAETREGEATLPDAEEADGRGCTGPNPSVGNEETPGAPRARRHRDTALWRPGARAAGTAACEPRSPSAHQPAAAPTASGGLPVLVLPAVGRHLSHCSLL
ncbi:hypothetical protein TREES_T100001723 [Tupaia chinensis]|uniref:Uncharacterized protein n=1 Tax=Tupaia chinensis TaxID=246437 RepID=L9KJ24_TUPCH|nr:hypothetical protein TREES_T100001723 [Tupaia chinensis]